MSTQFFDSLRHWFPLRETHRWVLGAVMCTEGPVYRKTGALMLLSDAGHQFGILSGGCLESDLQLQACKALAFNQKRCVIYDAKDEDGLTWKLGIGCGGSAEILLSPCDANNDFLQLAHMLEYLALGKACNYWLPIEHGEARIDIRERDLLHRVPGRTQTLDNTQWLCTLVNPPPHLLIVGSGADMHPVATIAHTMGWKVSVLDHRPANKQPFVQAVSSAEFIDAKLDALDASLLASIDAAIVASHNVEIDAQALRALSGATSLKYLGLLGPPPRRKEVLTLAGIDETSLPSPISGPMGLALGGDIPESIALSVLAECHAVVYGASAKPLSPAYF